MLQDVVFASPEPLVVSVFCGSDVIRVETPGPSGNRSAPMVSPHSIGCEEIVLAGPTVWGGWTSLNEENR